MTHHDAIQVAVKMRNMADRVNAVEPPQVDGPNDGGTTVAHALRGANGEPHRTINEVRGINRLV